MTRTHYISHQRWLWLGLRRGGNKRVQGATRANFFAVLSENFRARKILLLNFMKSFADDLGTFCLVFAFSFTNLYKLNDSAAVWNVASWPKFESVDNVGTEVVGYCRGPYQLRGQPSCCRSTGRSPN